MVRGAGRLTVLPLSAGDAAPCVRMYLRRNEPDFVEADPRACHGSLLRAVQSGEFVRKAVLDGTILGWIYATMSQPPYARYTVITQLFCCTEADPPWSLRAVAALHGAMADHGRARGARYAVSAGSFLDDRQTFARMLERLGWRRRNYMATLRLDAPARAVGGPGREVVAGAAVRGRPWGR